MIAVAPLCRCYQAVAKGKKASDVRTAPMARGLAETRGFRSLGGFPGSHRDELMRLICRTDADRAPSLRK